MATNKKIVSIDYTSRDFNTLKRDLINYSKRHYPETFKDFTEASFGSLLLDSVAYVGDQLSFYLDYQFNESLLASSNDYENALRLAKQLGYRFKGSPTASGKVAVYVSVPASSIGNGPNTDYIPILKKNSIIRSVNGTSFIITKDVNFSNSTNEVRALSIDDNTGNVTSYAIKAYADVISGEFYTTQADIGTFQKFKKVVINDSNVSEIVSVVDSDGHEYFEVQYLSEDIVYKTVTNSDPSTSQQTPELLIPYSVPRRFITEKDLTSTMLTFGHGSDVQQQSNAIPEPSEIIVQQFGRDYVSDVTFDPSNLVSNDSLGIAPANTTLTIKYRKNSTSSVNAAVGTITNVSNPIIDYPSPQLVPLTVRSAIRGSVECDNEEPINAGSANPTIEEIKRFALDNFATQNRAVTARDYEAFTYAMPSQFGSIKRVRAVRDPDSSKRNINLYVLSADGNNKLIKTNSAAKENIKNWLNKYRMLGDTIDILDAIIVNIDVNFRISVAEPFNRFEVLQIAIEKVREFFTNPLFIGQPINIYEVSTLLSKIDGVSDIADVSFGVKTTSGYSSSYVNLNKYTTSDGAKIIPPENVAFEVKFPVTDIKGALI
jgi:hypothetical protein